MPSNNRVVATIALATTLGLAVALGSSTGAAVAASAARPNDFDGDGRADLAIGVPGEAIGTKREAGLVNVLRGGTNGLTATGDQAWSQDSTGVPGASEGRSGTVGGDGFGSALASGDFDRDGRADLAIGVPFDRVGVVTNAGAVNVLYGTSTGLGATDAQLWTQSGLGDTSERGDGFGQALAAGDFDHDGYADLAVAAPAETTAVATLPGSVTVLWGGPTGLTATGATILTRGSLGQAGSSTAPGGFGYAVAAGDLDGDGFADLVASSPMSGASGDDPTKPAVAGRVTVVYGSSGGLTGARTQVWSHALLGGTGQTGDWWGSSLATGDLDGDGVDDLAVGVRYARVTGRIAGAVEVIYGTPSGLSATGKQWWHQDRPGVPDTAEVDDRFGAAVAIGDVNSDGRDDLAVGAPGEAIGSGEPGAGGVIVLRGSSGGLVATGASTWTQASPGVPGSPEATDIEWDFFGATLTILDVGRSRAADLVVGVPLERVGARQAAGMLNVLYGSATGVTGIGAQGWTQDSAGVVGTSESGDRFGGALAP